MFSIMPELRLDFPIIQFPVCVVIHSYDAKLAHTHTHAHTHRRRSFLNAKNISTANSFFSMSDIRKKEHSRNSSKHRQDLKQKSNYILYIFFIFYNILIVIIVDISIFCHYYYYLI